MPNSSQMMQAKLLVVGGSEVEEDEFTLSLPATIGRGRENGITLQHPLVSRQHCEIFAGENGAIMVRDMGSLNGTYVGSHRIEGDHELQPGDLLTVGIVTFRAALSNEDGVQLDPRLESVLDDESAADAENETRLAGGDWGDANAETEKMRDPAQVSKKPK